jgi:ABC transport system ATP-binding/permease protein
MKTLLSCQSISKSRSGRTIFSELSFSIEKRSRLGLIGRNGAGKSTLLSVLAGRVDPDSGSVTTERNTRIGYLTQQDLFTDPTIPIGEYLEKTLESAEVANASIATKVWLGIAGFEDPTVPIGSLSGGWQKRLSLATVLAQEPDLLLLDEPTNHLDFAGLQWLDTVLDRYQGAYIISTHDRKLLSTHCERIIEIADWYPKGYLSAQGNYQQFLEAREAYFTSQEATKQSLANKARRELAWLRAGVKARTTKQEARKKSAQETIAESSTLSKRLASRDRNASALKEFVRSDSRTKELLRARGVTKSFGDRVCFSGLDITLKSGDKLALVGPNGVGKSTLLRLLYGELKPDSGDVEIPHHVSVTLFTQTHDEISPESTLKEVLSADSDTVIFKDTAVHVISWARQLGFEPYQLAVPYRSLSGGERARAALSSILLSRSTILLLDEPTNDLDIETLEILEEGLCNFPGAIIFVSHDRFLLDRLPTAILAFSSDSHISKFPDFAQWLNTQSCGTGLPPAQNPDTAVKSDKTAPKVRLSWNEKKELSSIEGIIEKAEAEASAIQESLLNPQILANPQQVQNLTKQLSQQHKKIEDLYQRWEDLDAKRKAEEYSRKSERQGG